MTAPTEPVPEKAEADDRLAAPGQVIEAPTPPDPGHPDLGYGVVDRPRPRLPTFDEMLPAARAFYRRP